MAKYDETRFYWLQLKEDFFEDDAIEWLEEQENGAEQALFYLKLCLKSLKSNGVLYRKVGNMILPYDVKKLAHLTRTPVNTVQVALVNLSKIGLIRLLDNGEIYLEQVENLVGSQSKGAFKKQQQRRLSAHDVPMLPPVSDKVDKGVDKCPPELELELEQELDKEKEKELSLVETSPLSEVPYETITQWFNNLCPRLPKVIRMTPQRKKVINARWADYGKRLEPFIDLFTEAGKSDFLCGLNDRKWSANFDWLMKPSNFAKVLEGTYKNKMEMKKDGIKTPYEYPDEDTERSKRDMEALAKRFGF